MHDYAKILAHAYGQPRPLLRLSNLLPWQFVVADEHEFTLLYRQGRLAGVLSTGAHRLWGRQIQVVRLDRRRQIQEVPAQELPCADGVTVKVTAQVVWQITDPVAMQSQVADHRQTLYAAAQQAVRGAIGSYALTAIAGQRAAIAASMREAVATAVASIGVQVHAASLKDVMPNAESRRALAAVACAKAEALAALEKARGEQAALRALVNAARLIREQPELARIRGLQVLSEGLRGGAKMVVSASAFGMTGEDA
jgi:regulator of protease activity HflC (stomatin/prohibitin superfamily)